MNNLVAKILVVMASLSVVCFHAEDNQPRVALGWSGGAGIYDPLTGQELLRYNFPGSTPEGSPNVPQYISFLPPNKSGLLVSINKKHFMVKQENSEPVVSDPATESLQTATLIIKNQNACDIISAERAGYVKSYDAATGKLQENQFAFSGHEGVASLYLYSQGEGLFLVAGTTSGFIDIYNYTTGELVRSINCYEDGIHQGAWVNTVLAFKDGQSVKLIACTSIVHGQIGCWDAASGKKVYVVNCCDHMDPEQPNSGDVYNLNLYQDINGSLKLVTSAKDPARVIKIWNPLTGEVLQTLYDQRFDNTYPLPIRAFQSSDEQGEVVKLIVGYYSGDLAVWNTRTGAVEATVQQNQYLPRNVSTIIRFITLFQAEGQNYCTVGNDNGSVYTWKLEALQPVVNWSVGRGNSVSAMASSQELCKEPTRFQLGFFSAQMGCHVPIFSLDNQRWYKH